MIQKYEGPYLHSTTIIYILDKLGKAEPWMTNFDFTQFGLIYTQKEKNERKKMPQIR